MLILSESYQNYQNDTVNYRLTDEGGMCWRCESANLKEEIQRYSTFDHHFTVSLLYKNLPPLEWEEQIRHNLYCTSFEFSLLEEQPRFGRLLKHLSQKKSRPPTPIIQISWARRRTWSVL